MLIYVQLLLTTLEGLLKPISLYLVHVIIILKYNCIKYPLFESCMNQITTNLYPIKIFSVIFISKKFKLEFDPKLVQIKYMQVKFRSSLRILEI